MKSKVIFAFLLAFFLAVPLVKAQMPAPPPADFPAKDSNYAKYTDMVKQDIAWYEKAPLDKDTALRLQIARFLLTWISGSPAVTVSIGESIMPILKDKKNIYVADMLIAYMGGITLYELNNPNDKNEANIEVAGLQAVLELAKNNNELLANAKAIKKFKGMGPDDLRNYVNDCLKKQSK